MRGGALITFFRTLHLFLTPLAIFARIEYPGQASVHWNYVLLELDVIRRYVWMLVVPANQALFHDVARIGLFDLRALLAITVVGAMVAGICSFCPI